MLTVFTSGCFDLFHYGHLHFLLQARDLGDKLIVGVNCDEYFLYKKGRSPFFGLRQRMRMLSELKCVDQVCPFYEDDPCQLILRLRPDIVCKGSEYNYRNAPEAALIEEMGGRWVVLESLPIHTSDLIKRMV